MSDLKVVPNANAANRVAIADFAEMECLRRKDFGVSTLDIARIMGRGDESSDDDINVVIMDAYNDLANRVAHCGKGDGKYPYEISNNGNLLSTRDWVYEDDHLASMVYFFLLFATRLNMKTSRVHGDEDGTALFEQLCSEVAVRFWGGPGEMVGSIVFGTGREAAELDDHDELDVGKFSKAVTELCNAIREGQDFHPKSPGKITARDGKLDIVVWRGFTDQRHGQLIGFGQCKTGTHWKNDLTKLQPDSFCQKWMRVQPAAKPVRLYFVCDRVLDRWYDMCSDGGILFDRCRIMEYANEISKKLLKRIEKWVKAVAKAEGLKIP